MAPRFGGGPALRGQIAPCLCSCACCLPAGQRRLRPLPLTPAPCCVLTPAPHALCSYREDVDVHMARLLAEAGEGMPGQSWHPDEAGGFVENVVYDDLPYEEADAARQEL